MEVLPPSDTTSRICWMVPPQHPRPAPLPSECSGELHERGHLSGSGERQLSEELDSGDQQQAGTSLMWSTQGKSAPCPREQPRAGRRL